MVVDTYTRTQGAFGALSPSHLLLCPSLAFHSSLTPARNPSQVREMQRLGLMVTLLMLGCARGWEGNVDIKAYFAIDCDGVGAIADGRLTFVKTVSDSAPFQHLPACLASRVTAPRWVSETHDAVQPGCLASSFRAPPLSWRALNTHPGWLRRRVAQGRTARQALAPRS